jgi:hypothetical protein
MTMAFMSPICSPFLDHDLTRADPAQVSSS